jgi:Protein of unknown function (DUF3300)
MPKLVIRLAMFVLLLLAPLAAQAQNQTTSTIAASDAPLLKPAELDALLAPIALYPDPLITNILMAATYPLEIVQADRWIKDNSPKLQGNELLTAAEKQSWDDSVKALVATPAVLDMMSAKLDWTQKLGDAVLAQEDDVMDAIQRLRGRAYDKQTLSSNDQQTITVSQDQGRQVIAIAPASPDSISVPYYDPAVAYGEWPYPDYPAYPYAWPAPGYIGAGVLATGLAFGGAYALGRWANNYWGNNINWRNNNININRGAHVEHWQHNPQHRGGVRYGNANVQQKFGNAGVGRDNIRGSGNLGDRAGAGNRAKAGDRAGAGNRPNTGDRQAGNRANAAKGQAGNRAQTGKGGAAKTKAANAKAGGNRKNAANGARQGGAKNAAARNRGGTNVARSGGGRGGQSAGGRSSFASANVSRAGMGGARAGGMGGARMGGGGARMGGGGGRGGGGRRSDIRLKHDIVLLGHLDNGLGLYRFAYNGGEKSYVGVMAQEVEQVRPDAVVHGHDGYLRVRYDRLGLSFQTYDQWLAHGARPAIGR